MPITPVGSLIPDSWTVNLTGGPDSEEVFTVELITPSMSTEGQIDDAVQSLVDHLAAWPDLMSMTASKKAVQPYAIAPTP